MTARGAAFTLLPCAFCGSHNVHLQNSTKAPNGDYYVIGWCADCGAATRDERDDAHATAAWNRRASADDLLAALKKARIAIATWSPAPNEPLEEIDALIAKHGAA